MQIEWLQEWLIPAAFLVGGITLGLLAERVILPLLLRAARRLDIDSVTLVARSLKGMVLLWGFLAGLSGAIAAAPMKPDLIRFLEKIPVVLFLLSLTVLLARISVGIFDLKAGKGKGDTPTISLFSNLIKLGVYILGILVILQTLGVSITPVLTALGVGGLAVALALQETLSNLFAGLQIIAARQVKPGDFVHLDTGEEGYVTDVTWRNTTIKGINNNMVIVPNSKLASAILTNYHQPAKEMLVFVPVGVHYDSDLEQVERVTLEVIRDVQAAVNGAKRDHEPRIRYNEFGSSSINFRAVLAVEEFLSGYELTHEFVKHLKRRYNEEGITIPFNMVTLDIPDNPQLTLNLRDRNGDAPKSGASREPMDAET
ncbi:MAG: mechanosensitive ion channel family protein [bacterium]|nr:mechanosensitive ion channel family protein [bacterium]MDT8395537.1 mechanosensitive ion channel family protein [bacterium]